jgi:hypothetical protein
MAKTGAARFAEARPLASTTQEAQKPHRLLLGSFRPPQNVPPWLRHKRDIGVVTTGCGYAAKPFTPGIARIR